MSAEKVTTLCDADALPCAKKLALYLHDESVKGHVLYGHQNDLHRKAGRRGLCFSSSDTFDVTGHYAAVNGIDALSITGTEHGKWNWPEKKRVRAAVKLALRTVKQGSIVSLSAHMPNFEIINERTSLLKDGSVNYSGYTPNKLFGNVVKNILDNGRLHTIFDGYLDLVCDFCLELQKKNIALIWRPFHENTGGWFWWGCNTCTPQEFKKLWQYTWDYMVQKRGVHNLIWAYSPGSEIKTIEQFTECSEQSFAGRYPGDEYVDLIGFDMYEQLPAQNDTFFAEYEKQMKLVADFAVAHGKLWANTETGVSHPDNRALLTTGNEDFDWYTKVLDVNAKYGSCYFLLWANFSAKWAFYAPYVTAKRGIGKHKKLEGHELLGSFLRMYDDERSVFSNEDGLNLLYQE